MRSRSRYSAISLVIESERECTGADTDAHVDTLLYYAALLLLPLIFWQFVHQEIASRRMLFCPAHTDIKVWLPVMLPDDVTD